MKYRYDAKTQSLIQMKDMMDSKGLFAFFIILGFIFPALVILLSYFIPSFPSLLNWNMTLMIFGAIVVLIGILGYVSSDMAEGYTFIALLGLVNVGLGIANLLLHFF